VFVTGKGGVGKTTLACATALWAADQGLRTLLVTTDPAAHIGNVLEAPVGDGVAPVDGVRNLWAVRIDAKATTAAYIQTVLDDASRSMGPEGIARMREELASPCTEEVAVFQRFLDLLLADAHEVVVFDTAPTGHTLRLLELPLSYERQLQAKVWTSEESRAVDAAQTERMRSALGLLRDGARTSFVLVVYPERTPIAEAGRAWGELDSLGIRTAFVVCNQVLPEEAASNAFFRRRRAMQLEHLESIGTTFPGVPVLPLGQRAGDVRGLDALRDLARELYGKASIQDRSDDRRMTGG
jgi:arsenite-transporting ATPase